MSFLNLEGKTFLITGVANRKSIAFSVAKSLIEQKAKVIITIQDDEMKKGLLKYFPNEEFFKLDVSKSDSFIELSQYLEKNQLKLDGMLHSIAFANYTNPVEFHETSWEHYAEAIRISQYSLIELSNCLKDYLVENASIVAMSISNTKITSYGYMGPIKSALDQSISYLAKSFSKFSRVRFNAVCAGPLKTSASSGIPGYIDNYLFAEKLTLRKEALKTIEVSNTVLFLLSEKSSGINASGITVDAGINCNFFDEEVVRSSVN